MSIFKIVALIVFSFISISSGYAGTVKRSPANIVVGTIKIPKDDFIQIPAFSLVNKELELLGHQTILCDHTGKKGQFTIKLTAGQSIEVPSIITTSWRSGSEPVFINVKCEDASN